ncbi:DUF6478 family protein [Actibacterium sp. XHP0104]|uniref:DUF6478 family protein n=1 Tax=Actibacterium sp. XHP0104 TaxID=2984335 RepID=UPI0021E81333|nr:DUF6478 family protein [Actibacterium sp. XHP0104]MCV2881667.1 DUF6478 family protein [Actibacterium sp. XHP0104]
MANQIEVLVDRLLQKRVLRRWTRAADRAGDLPLHQLRGQRARARALRRQIDRLIHVADARLTLPMIGSSVVRRPMGSDWAYRPQLWAGPLDAPGAAAVETKTAFGDEVTVFHDCAVSELTVRQVRNTRETDLAPFGLRMDVFRFDGSFLSLVVGLPQAGVNGLGRRHVVRMDAIVEMEKPLEIFARLNVRHGPNTEQIVRELPLKAQEVFVEFDLAYTKLNEKRVEAMWVDLIFEGPEMNQVILRDVTFSRRPRAEL